MSDGNQLIDMHLYLHKFVDIGDLSYTAGEFIHTIRHIPFLQFNLNRFSNLSHINVSTVLRWVLLNKHHRFALEGHGIKNVISTEITTELLQPQFALDQLNEYTNWVNGELPKIESEYNDQIGQIQNIVPLLMRAHNRKLSIIRVLDRWHKNHKVLQLSLPESQHGPKNVFGSYIELLSFVEILHKENMLI